MLRRPTLTFALPTVCAPSEDDVTRIVREGGVLTMRIDGELIVHRVGAPRRRAGRGQRALAAAAS